MIVRTEADLREAMLRHSESEHLEFKEAKSDYDFDKLTHYCCALANEGGGSIILGVTDKMPRRIVGTAAFPNLDKAKKGLFDRLHIRVETAVIKTADGRVLVFIMPARSPGLPVHVAGRYLMRVGSSLTAMSPQQLAVIFQESIAHYSAEPAAGTTVAMLDTAAIEQAFDAWLQGIWHLLVAGVGA